MAKQEEQYLAITRMNFVEVEGATPRLCYPSAPAIDPAGAMTDSSGAPIYPYRTYEVRWFHDESAGNWYGIPVKHALFCAYVERLSIAAKKLEALEPELCDLDRIELDYQARIEELQRERSLLVHSVVTASFWSRLRYLFSGLLVLAGGGKDESIN